MNEDTDRIEGPIEGLDRLERARAPSRDLWPGIDARLNPRRSRYGLVQFALAASLVAGLASVFTLTLRDVTVAGQQAEVADAGAPIFTAGLTYDTRAIVTANLSMVRQAERQLKQALKQTPDSPTLRSLLASTETRQRALSAML